jgi:hypothetical protein
LNFVVGVIVNNLQAVEIEQRDDIAEIRKTLTRMETQLQSNQNPKPDEDSSTPQQKLERAS